MFTGLIESVGTVLALKPTQGAMRLIVAAPELAGRWKIGDSIAVNGVCLTAIDMEEEDEPHPGRFAADLAGETIDRTTLAGLHPGALVNLELPTPSGSPMGGHVVQGHVDATGTIVSLIPLHPDLDRTDWRLCIEVPPSLAGNIIPQGSITVDGISLTVAKVAGLTIEIAVIPHTYKATNLRSLLSGSAVNLEADVLSKYAVRRASLSIAEVEAPPEIMHEEPVEEPAMAASWPPPHDEIQWAAQNPVLPTNQSNKDWLTQAYLLENGY